MDDGIFFLNRVFPLKNFFKRDGDVDFVGIGLELI